MMEIISVVNGVLEYLRNGIITGELEAGQKLNEDQLATKFGISRPPLREAFKILESELLVRSIPRRGCYVTGTSIEDFEQISETRIMIECYAIDILNKKNIRDISKISSAFNLAINLDLSKWSTITTRERLEYFKALADYHIKLVESTGNNLLIHFYRTINYNLARYQYMYNMRSYNPDSFQLSQEEHKRIMKYIEAGEYEQAKDDLRSHINNFVNRLKEKIKEQKIDSNNLGP